MKHVLGTVMMLACASGALAAEPRDIRFNGQKATEADLTILSGYEKS